MSRDPPHEIRGAAWRPTILELHNVMDAVGKQAILLAGFDELAERVGEQLPAPG